MCTANYSTTPCCHNPHQQRTKLHQPFIWSLLLTVDVLFTDDLPELSLVRQAAHRGMLSICELVVEKDVDVAAMSDDGITALIAAASEGHAAIVELLLGKAKAGPDAKDKVTFTK